MARPPEYTQEIADYICGEIVKGRSMRSICSEENMPCVKTIFNWFNAFPKFLQQYEKAKEMQADTLADELIDIADDGTNDWMLKNAKDNPGWVANGEHIQRSRLRVDARKWAASKLKAKKYGDSTQLRHADANGEKLQISDILGVLDGRSTSLPEA